MSAVNFYIFTRTIGIKNDTRLRKIISTMSNSGHTVRGFLWERKNEAHQYLLDSNSTITTERLAIASTRIPRGGAVINFMEMLQETMTTVVKVICFRPDIVMIQNHRAFMAVIPLFLAKFFGLTKRFIWDLRELPFGFMHGFVRKKIFSFLLMLPDSVIVVNESRLMHMRTLYGDHFLKHTYIVQNFVDSKFSESPLRQIDELLSHWLGSRKYFYIQNPAAADRLLIESCIAVGRSSDKVIVVTGKISDRMKSEIQLALGEKFYSLIYFAGLVPEEQLMSYIDNAYASIILYQSSQPNNLYAEPNRLYQSLARGIPAVVGSNPTMGSVINSCGGGVVLEDDGSSIVSIEKGIKELDANYLTYKVCADKSRQLYLWEKSESLFLDAVRGPLCK